MARRILLRSSVSSSRESGCLSAEKLGFLGVGPGLKGGYGSIPERASGDRSVGPVGVPPAKQLCRDFGLSLWLWAQGMWSARSD